MCLEGTLETLTFQKEENDFTIARLRTFDKEMVTILATLINPTLGESMQLWGRWQTHPRFGPQFKVERYQLIKPVDPRGHREISRQRDVQRHRRATGAHAGGEFRHGTIDIIEKNPGRLTEVIGIGKKKARADHQGVAGAS